MSEYGITPTGFKRKRLDQILQELNDGFKAAFGDNWDTDPESPQGQAIGSIAEALADLWEMGEGAYNAFNPSGATGISLSNLVTLNSLNRSSASPTIVTLELTGVPGTTVPSGSLVSIEGGAQFSTTETVEIENGIASVTARSVETGPIQAQAGTITSIDTPITGWDTVSNPQAGILGRTEESDTDLRARRERSTSLHSQNLFESLVSGLLSTPDVVEVSLLENDTDFTDDNGLPPHSFEAVVLGGDPEDIGDTIWLNKPFGIESHGDETVSITDSQGFPHSMRFTRPTLVDIYITVEVVTNDDVYPSDGDDQIKQRIVEYANGELIPGIRLGIGDRVRYSRLYTPINSVRGHWVEDLRIGTSPNPTGTSNLEIAYNERPLFTAANIQVIHSVQ